MKAKASPDSTAIQQTLDLYAAGLRDGSVAKLKLAFRPQAIVSGYIGTEKFVKPVQFLYEYVREQKAAVKQSPPPPPDILSIAVAGSTAVVALHERSYIGYDYTTNLQLMKINGRWWIVSKLFNGTPAI